MIQKMNNRPEEVLLVSGVKEIGQAVNLNRERTAITILGVANSNNSIVTERLASYVSDGINDSEKASMSRELDGITRDFQTMKKEAYDNSVEDSSEYSNLERSYKQLYNLYTKVIGSVGVYNAPDVVYIPTYYEEYSENALNFSDFILNIQTENSRIDNYYSRIKVSVNISPEEVSKNSNTTISASVMYEGVEKIGSVSASSIVFYLTGLASGVSSSAFILPSGGSVDIDGTSAEVTGCKTFQLAYAGIGSTVNVECALTLDSSSMPF